MRKLGITKTILLQVFLALESTLDVIEAYNSVQNVVETLELVKTEVDDYHTRWCSNTVELAAKVEVVPTMPRIIATMRHRAKIPAENEEIYFKRNLTIPLVRRGILFHRTNVNVMTDLVDFVKFC